MEYFQDFIHFARNSCEMRQPNKGGTWKKPLIARRFSHEIWISPEFGTLYILLGNILTPYPSRWYFDIAETTRIYLWLRSSMEMRIELSRYFVDGLVKRLSFAINSNTAKHPSGMCRVRLSGTNQMMKPSQYATHSSFDA